MKKRTAARIISAFLCLLLFLFSTLPLSAASTELPDTTSAKSFVLYHLDRDKTVLSKEEDTLLPAGSTVKLLSGLLFCELLESRQNESILLTSEMITSDKFLSVGDVVTIRELLYLAICASNNNAFQVLSRVIAQSTSAFSNLMMQRARELGLEKSVFNDPIGLSDSSFTTAAELAKIAAAAYQNSLYMQICSTPQYYLPSLSKSITNRNEMIIATSTNRHYNSKCNGMSAGTTTLAGDCIVASVSNGSESYVCVVLGCNESATADANQAYAIANRLSYWVYASYKNIEVITPDTVICKLPVTVSDMTVEVEVKADQAVSAYLPISAEIGKDVTYSIRLSYTELEAPVTEGTFVGYVAILYQGEILATASLYTAGSAARSSFISSLKSIQDLLGDRRMIAGGIFFIVLLTAWITVGRLYNRHQRKRWNKYFSAKIDTTKR